MRAVVGKGSRKTKSVMLLAPRLYSCSSSSSSSSSPPLFSPFSSFLYSSTATTTNSTSSCSSYTRSLCSETTVSMDVRKSGATETNLATVVSDQKRTLRAKIRKDLRSLSPSQRRKEDESIQNIVLDSSWFGSCTSLCAYISCEALREVDTSKILSEILNNSLTDGHKHMTKRLYVPRVEDKNSNMRMLCISTLEDLVKNSMNILEPSPVDGNGNPREDVMMANAPVDLLLLPGLAFDRTGHRIGRGGGYYDVFLHKYHALAAERKWKKPLLVALAYSVQIMDEDTIPVTENDFPVDVIVSPSGLINTNDTALERMAHIDK